LPHNSPIEERKKKKKRAISRNLIGIPERERERGPQASISGNEK
jgi:hypothetical protein